MDKYRHGGRDKARYRFRRYCLPLRLVLIGLFVGIIPRLPSGGDVLYLSLQGTIVLWTVARIYAQRCMDSISQWWYVEYILFEAVLAIVLFFTLPSLSYAVYVMVSLYLTKWLCSLYLAVMWPATTSLPS